jgi:hypothetical protein
LGSAAGQGCPTTLVPGGDAARGMLGKRGGRALEDLWRGVLVEA